MNKDPPPLLFPILRKEVRLRKEEFGVLVYEVGERPEFKVINPSKAVILSLMDGSMSIKELKEAVAYIFNSSIEEAKEAVNSVLDEFSDLIELRKEKAKIRRRYDPLDFVYKPKKPREGLIRYKAPLRMALVLTRRCPLDCIYCYADRINASDPEKTLGLERLREILEEAGSLGMSDVYLAGGEPLLRKDFPEVVKMALDAGVYPHTSTKGWPVTEELVQRIAETGMDSMQVSIDTLDPKLQDMLTQRVGSHARMVRAIQLFLRAGFKVSTNTVICSYNISEVPDLVKWLAEQGVSEINLSPYSLSIYKPRDDLFPTIEQYQVLISELDKVEAEVMERGSILHRPKSIEGLLSGLTMEGAPGCGGITLGMIVLPDGRVTICERLGINPDFIYGDLSKQSIVEAWNSSRIKEILATFNRENFKGSPCYSCETFEKCVGAGKLCYFRIVAAYGGMKVGVPDPLCHMSPARIKDVVR